MSSLNKEKQSSKPSSSSLTTKDLLPNNVINIKIPKNNNFDQETARYLLQKCSTLIVENFPVGSEFGIDLSIHYTGKNFLGLKMIPPGIHFMHFSFVNKQTKSVAPRIGFFYCFLSGEILVTRWDPKEEDIIFPVQDHDQVRRLRDNFAQGFLDTQLGAYQFDTYQTWVSLTDYISQKLFQRMNPLCGKIFSASNLVYKPNEDGSTSFNRNHKVDGQGLPDMIISPESAIRFISSLPKHFFYPEGSEPNEITRHSMDSSYTLNHLIQIYHNGNEFDLLGELQFAFVSFLLGHQYEAFEFWSNLLRIICSAQKALQQRCEFYLAFIRVLHFQLKQTNEALFADIVENENQVYHSVRTFFLNLHIEQEHIQHKELVERSRKFEHFLSKTLLWDFGDLDNEDNQELDDEKPVVVIL